MSLRRISFGLPTKPSARIEHALAYDPKRNAVFQFGGWDFSATVFNGLWVWYLDRPEEGWREVPIQGPKPAARSDMGLIVDTKRDRLVMHGGVDVAFTFLTGTWALDLGGVDSGLASWVDLSPTTTPPGRFPVTMAYDSARDRIVRFGGLDSGFVEQKDTQEFDGTDWTDVTPAAAGDSPSARALHSLTYDPVRGQTVVFGGSDGGGDALAETHLWGGGPAWVEFFSPLTPPARLTAPFAYSARLGGSVISLGIGESSFVLGPARPDTWVLSLDGWRELHSSDRPGLRDSIPSAAAAHPDGEVIHGGLDQEGPGDPLGDTWLIAVNEEWAEPAIGFVYDLDVIEIVAGLRLKAPATTATGVARTATTFAATSLSAFVAVSTIPGADLLLFAIEVDGQAMWWDSAAWVASDLTQAEMNTEADVHANIAELLLTGGKDVGLAMRPVSDDGSTTPELEQVEITYVAATAEATAATTVTERKVLVAVVQAGLGLESEPDPATGAPWNAVPLTSEYLAPRGGVPYQVGQDWGAELTLMALRGGTWTPIDLSAWAFLLTVSNRSTGATILTRDTADNAQLRIDADPTTGKLRWLQGQAETPLPGQWNWKLVGTKAPHEELAACGVVEIVAAVPA